MKPGQTELMGRRVDDYHEFWKSGPGTYRRSTISGEGFESVVCWHVQCPGGCGNSMLLGPKPPAAGHFVKEEPDGSITCELSPPEDPTNSNSTLCPVCGWHGQCIKGLWKTV